MRNFVEKVSFQSAIFKKFPNPHSTQHKPHKSEHLASCCSAANNFTSSTGTATGRLLAGGGELQGTMFGGAFLFLAGVRVSCCKRDT